MGLVMLGSGQQKATEEMLSYAHETQHEKIIRGLAIGVAFLYYGLQESADAVIETALKEKVSVNPTIDFTLLNRTTRTPCSDTAASTRLRLLMPVLVTLEQLGSCYTSRSQILRTMCGELLLLR